MKINGWGTVENIRTIKDSVRLLNLFQDFYTATGRLPTFNELLVVPDDDANPEEKINLKQLYDMFKNTNWRGIVSLPFSGLLFHYFHDEKSLELVKTATTELYKNLSYMTLSGRRQFSFDGVSDLVARLSFSIKSFTSLNQKQAQIEREKLAKKINDGRIFIPKINNPLDDVSEIMDDPNVEYKKTKFPYVEPTVQLPDEIEDTQKRIDDDYVDLLNKIYGVNDVITEQNKNKKVETGIEDVLDPTLIDDYWWENDMFDSSDKQPTIDATKMIIDNIQQTTKEPLHNIDIQALSDNILRNLRPRDYRTIQELIDDDFIPIDDGTQQELEDDDYISLASDDERVSIEDVFEPPTVTIKDTVEPPLVIPPTEPPKTDVTDTTKAWDKNKTEIAKPGPVYKLSTTDYDKKVKAANKIKNRYLTKMIGKRYTSNKISLDWLKKAGFLDTKDQDKINYIFVPPKKEDSHQIPWDAGHFIKTEIDNTDFKNGNLASKDIRKKGVRKPYLKTKKDRNENETIKILENIAILEPGKNAQIAAKKINDKYRKKYKLPGKVAVGDVIETADGKKIKIVTKPSNISSLIASKKIKEKYKNLRKNKILSKKIVDSNKKDKMIKEIETVEKIKTASEKKFSQENIK